MHGTWRLVMKKGLLVCIIVLAAAAGAAEGWYYHTYNDWKIWNLDINDAMSRLGLGSAVQAETVYVTAVGTLMGVSSGVQNRYAGVVEAQDTLEIKIDNGRRVGEVEVKVGDEVARGQVLFKYDLSSIQENLQQAQLDLERLKNEALSYQDQIATLEREKANAKADAQLSYTVEIETNRMNLKKNEYDQKKKQAEIEKLEGASVNTEVRSEIDGIIQKIDTSKMNTGTGDSITDTLEEDSFSYSGSQDTSNAFITILSTGAYRVKGTVNELNVSSIIPGSPVLIRSRVDETRTWYGTMGNVDRENASTNSGGGSYWGMMDSGGDNQTSSSTYPFYVELESSEDLMLGQHVYIEISEDSLTASREGVWLSEFFIAGLDTDSPYVWAASENNRLEKRALILGEHDPDLMEYEIREGLSNDDRIAFPTSKLAEGMVTVNGTNEQTMSAWFAGDEEAGSGEDGVDFIADSIGEEDESAPGDSTEGDYVIDEDFDYVIYDENGNVVEDPDFTGEGADSYIQEFTGNFGDDRTEADRTEAPASAGAVYGTGSGGSNGSGSSSSGSNGGSGSSSGSVNDPGYDSEEGEPEVIYDDSNTDPWGEGSGGVVDESTIQGFDENAVWGDLMPATGN